MPGFFCEKITVYILLRKILKDVDFFHRSGYNVVMYLKKNNLKEGTAVKKKNVFQSLVLVTQFGITMLVPILLCTLIGAYIGEKFSVPIITVPLFLIGALAGFRNVYIMAKKTYEDKDRGNAKKD